MGVTQSCHKCDACDYNQAGQLFQQIRPESKSRMAPFDKMGHCLSFNNHMSCLKGLMKPFKDIGIDKNTDIVFPSSFGEITLRCH
jgi:hypothetical protein